jgi:glucose 1-dehydrogenase
MCRDGRYGEHGIKELDGFLRERYRIRPDYAVEIDPSLARTGVLLEPTSVVAKAWEQIDRIASRTVWRPRLALVTGAGPIGLLAALLGVQRGLEVHVLDRACCCTAPSPSSRSPSTARSSSTPWASAGFSTPPGTWSTSGPTAWCPAGGPSGASPWTSSWRWCCSLTLERRPAESGPLRRARLRSKEADPPLARRNLG